METENKEELKVLHCIQAGNYPHALQMLEKYDLNRASITKQDYAFYLYLLGFISGLSNKNIRKAQNYIHQHKNEVSNHLMRLNFYRLLKQMDTMPESEKDTINFQIKTVLLAKASHLVTGIQKQIMEFIEQKEYTNLISYLEEQRDKGHLPTSNLYVLKIAKDLVALQKDQIIPTIKNNKIINHYINSYQMIKNKDYISALEAENKYIDSLPIEQQQQLKNKPLYKILEVMNNEIMEMQRKQEFEKYTLDYVMSCLTEFSLKDAVNTVETFLQLNHLENYQNLIVNLMKIGFLEKDETYEKARKELLKMQDKDYEPSVELFVKDFCSNLESKNYLIAQRYCDLITNLDVYKNDSEFMHNLSAIVQKIKPKDKKANDLQLDKNLFDFLSTNTLSTQLLTNASALKVNQLGQNEEYMYDYLAYQHDQLDVNDGVILLSPISASQFLTMKNIISKNYEDMLGFLLTIDDVSTMLLKKQSQERIELKPLRQAANKDYTKQHYNSCINKFKTVITTQKTLNPYDFTRVGMAYLKKMKMEQAYKFLSIGEALKSKNNKSDYSAILQDIRSDLSMVCDNNYPNDVLDPKTMQKIEEVSSLIRQSGCHVDEACKKLNLSSEEINLVNLVCARDSYLDNQEEAGNQYLKMVEKSPNKAESVKTFLKHVRDNKKFYLKNRNTAKQLILKGN